MYSATGFETPDGIELISNWNLITHCELSSVVPKSKYVPWFVEPLYKFPVNTPLLTPVKLESIHKSVEKSSEWSEFNVVGFTVPILEPPLKTS